MLEQILQKLSPLQKFGTLGLIGTETVLSSVLNFITFRCYNIFPPILYTYFPTVSKSIFLVINLTLPLAHDKSCNVVYMWPYILYKDLNRSRNVKYKRRVIKSVEPLRLFVGVDEHNFFYIKRSTKINMFTQIITQNVNLLLIIPARNVRNVYQILNNL
jgi:hypothetical protein